MRVTLFPFREPRATCSSLKLTLEMRGGNAYRSVSRVGSARKSLFLRAFMYNLQAKLEFVYIRIKYFKIKI